MWVSGGQAEHEPPMCPCGKGEWCLGLQKEECWQWEERADPLPLLTIHTCSVGSSSGLPGTRESRAYLEHVQ